MNDYYYKLGLCCHLGVMLIQLMSGPDRICAFSRAISAEFWGLRSFYFFSKLEQKSQNSEITIVRYKLRIARVKKKKRILEIKRCSFLYFFYPIAETSMCKMCGHLNSAHFFYVGLASITERKCRKNVGVPAMPDSNLHIVLPLINPTTSLKFLLTESHV